MILPVVTLLSRRSCAEPTSSRLNSLSMTGRSLPLDKPGSAAIRNFSTRSALYTTLRARKVVPSSWIRLRSIWQWPKGERPSGNRALRQQQPQLMLHLCKQAALHRSTSHRAVEHPACIHSSSVSIFTPKAPSHRVQDERRAGAASHGNH